MVDCDMFEYFDRADRGHQPAGRNLATANPPPKKVKFSSNFPVHKTEPPYHPPADSAKARGASGVIIARVTLVAFGGAERINRAVAAAATASGGRGGI